MKQINQCRLGTPRELNIPTDKYVQEVAKLLLNVAHNDPTIIPRSADHLQKYYEHSVVIIDPHNKIIAHGACFPAHMVNSEIVVNGNTYPIGEHGSVAVSSQLQ